MLPANTLALINAAIGPSPNITWVAISWTLGLAVGFTLVGRLSDIFGRRWFFIGASVLGLVGNIIGASAQSIDMLIATNCINGLAAAGQLSFHITLGELVARPTWSGECTHLDHECAFRGLWTTCCTGSICSHRPSMALVVYFGCDCERHRCTPVCHILSPTDICKSTITPSQLCSDSIDDASCRRQVEDEAISSNGLDRHHLVHFRYDHRKWKLLV